MGLLARMGTLLKAKTNAILEASENPAQTLDYSYEKQLDLLKQVQRGIVDEVTSKHRVEQQAAALRSQAAALDTQATQALAGGREDLARLALQRKQAILQQLQGLETQIADLEAEQQRLTTSEMNLRAKIEAFRTHKEVIKAQYSAGEAEVRIGEALHGVSEEMADVGMAVERAEQKTSQLRARASALNELAASGVLTDVTGSSSGNDISQELAQLTASQNVESELEAMKKKLGAGRPPKQLGPGR